MKNICKIEVEMELNVMLFLERGTCVAHDASLDAESEDFSIPDLFREEIRNMGDLESHMGDEKVEIVWIKDLIGILEEYQIKAEAHNAGIDALNNAAA